MASLSCEVRVPEEPCRPTLAPRRRDGTNRLSHLGEVALCTVMVGTTLGLFALAACSPPSSWGLEPGDRVAIVADDRSKASRSGTVEKILDEETVSVWVPGGRTIVCKRSILHRRSF